MGGASPRVLRSQVIGCGGYLPATQFLKLVIDQDRQFFGPIIRQIQHRMAHHLVIELRLNARLLRFPHQVFDRLHHDAGGRVEYHFVLLDYLCTPRGGTLARASDAADARWVDIDDLTAALSGLTAQDTQQVYTNLRNASQHHLVADRKSVV